MKYALIDMGSNTIHMCVYEVIGTRSTKLFQKKIAAGIASYVEDGNLSENGIKAAVDALRAFNQILNVLEIIDVDVFATASLRNIDNQEEVLRKITLATGRRVEIVSGSQVGIFGYYGLVQEIHPEKGYLVDIGGGSTEITAFSQKGPMNSVSYPIGCLNIYKQNVNGHVIPTQKERTAISASISHAFEDVSYSERLGKRPTLYAVGGSARAVKRLCNYYFGNDEDNTKLKRKQVRELRKYLEKKGQDRIDLLIRYCPDRFHTIIPGMMILEALSERMCADSIEVASSGVREGYLYNKIVNGLEDDTFETELKVSGRTLAWTD